jgi:hypothetical protein
MHGQSKRFGQHIFVVADANLTQIFFKEKCKSIVNGKKAEGRSTRCWPPFLPFGCILYRFCKVIVSRMVRPKMRFIKYIYQLNKLFILVSKIRKLTKRRFTSMGDKASMVWVET